MKKFLIILSVLLFGNSLIAQSLIWAKNVGGEQNFSSGSNIATDALGNVYSRGPFDGTIDFDPGPGVFNLTAQGASPNNYILKLDVNGNFVWAKQLNEEYGSAGDITVDSSGNLLILGLFNGTLDFDPGAGVFELTSAGESDLFLLKLNADGNFIWAKQFRNASFVNESSFTVDEAGNVYTYFNAFGTVDMDPGNGVFNLTPTGSSGSFISKLDAAGNFVWGKQFEGSASVNSNGVIDTDSAGNLYITSTFGDTVDFDPGPGIFNLTAPQGAGFLVKLNNVGDFVYAQQFDGTNLKNFRALKISSTGAIYLAGRFSGTMDFDPSNSVFELTTSGQSDSDFFFCKLDNDGNFIWAKKVGGTGGLQDEDFPNIVLDDSENITVTGFFVETIDFDPGNDVAELTSNGGFDIFVLKFDSSGNYWHAINFGNSEDDGATAIAIDAENNISITGDFAGTVDFDPSAAVFNLDAGNMQDAFIVKLNNATLGILENQLNNLTIFPNPSNGNFTIDLGREYYNATVQIYNIFGQRISFSTFASAKTIEIEITGSAGIYFVEVGTADGLSKTLKTIKEK